MKTIEDLAKGLYETYCEAVGGVAFNGDPLPGWEAFAADPGKAKQAEAWCWAAKYSRRELWVPGVWICDTCGFRQEKIILCPAGAFADMKLHGEPCPNDGDVMRPLTYPELAKENASFGTSLLNWATALRTALARLLGVDADSATELDQLEDQLELGVRAFPGALADKAAALDGIAALRLRAFCNRG